TGGMGGGAGGNAGTANGGQGGGGAAGTGGSGGVTGVDAGTDSGHPLNLHCGNTLCSAPTEFCCIPEGAAARCVAATSVGNCPDSAAKVRCDDPTDCPIAGQVCCAQDGLMGN